MENKNNLWIIVLVLVLVLVFFGGYGLMGFSGGMMHRYYGFGGLFWLICLVAAIWVIYDVLVNNKELSDGMKVLWILLAIFFNIITAIIYYLVGRSQNKDLFLRNTRRNRRRKR